MVVFLGNEVVAHYRIRVGTRIGSAALRADGLHARADGLTSLAVVLGAIGVALGFSVADPVIGLLIAGLIVVVMVRRPATCSRDCSTVSTRNWSTPPTATLADHPGVVGVNRVRMRWLGLDWMPTSNSTSIRS